jgi:hypothetical protein
MLQYVKRVKAEAPLASGRYNHVGRYEYKEQHSERV